MQHRNVPVEYELPIAGQGAFAVRSRSVLDPARQEAKRHNDSKEALVCGTVTGKRWHPRNFTKAVRHVARRAGLPDDLQIRDLLRTAATEGASAGATPAEMMAVGGWANLSSIRPYLVQTREQAATFQAKRDVYRQRSKQIQPTRTDLCRSPDAPA